MDDMDDMEVWMREHYRQMNICTEESHRISEKMNIDRSEYKRHCFRGSIGFVGNDEYKASISVPSDANFGLDGRERNTAGTAEIMLFKNDEGYYNDEWGYGDVCRFWCSERASDDENIEDLNNELERLRNCIKDYNNYINSIIIIQRQWRKCRYDPKYKMCETVQMSNLENIEN